MRTKKKKIGFFFELDCSVNPYDYILFYDLTSTYPNRIIISLNKNQTINVSFKYILNLPAIIGIIHVPRGTDVLWSFKNDKLHRATSRSAL